jgi:hypothetical protein
MDTAGNRIQFAHDKLSPVFGRDDAIDLRADGVTIGSVATPDRARPAQSALVYNRSREK